MREFESHSSHFSLSINVVFSLLKGKKLEVQCNQHSLPFVKWREDYFSLYSCGTTLRALQPVSVLGRLSPGWVRYSVKKGPTLLSPKLSTLSHMYASSTEFGWLETLQDRQVSYLAPNCVTAPLPLPFSMYLLTDEQPSVNHCVAL